MNGKGIPGWGPDPYRRTALKPLLNTRDTRSRVPELLDGLDSVLGETLRLVLSRGAGLLVSPTQDGGALSFTVYLGDDRFRGYASSPEELQATLERLSNIGAVGPGHQGVEGPKTAQNARR